MLIPRTDSNLCTYGTSGPVQAPTVLSVIDARTPRLSLRSPSGVGLISGRSMSLVFAVLFLAGCLLDRLQKVTAEAYRSSFFKPVLLLCTWDPLWDFPLCPNTLLRRRDELTFPEAELFSSSVTNFLPKSDFPLPGSGCGTTPIIRSLNLLNRAPCKGLVKKSPVISAVGHHSNSTSPF